MLILDDLIFDKNEVKFVTKDKITGVVIESKPMNINDLNKMLDDALLYGIRKDGKNDEQTDITVMRENGGVK